MASVIILGPTDWREGVTPTPEPPADLVKITPAEWEIRNRDPLSPADIRAALCGDLRERGISATMMEFHERREDETWIDLLERIEEHEEVELYLVYRPPGMAGDGTDWELALLTNRMNQGDPHDVRLLVHPEAGTLEAGGTLWIHEPDRGTGYYEDLITLGAPVIPWETYDHLFEAARTACRSLDL